MPKLHSNRSLKSSRRLVGVLPLSALSFAIAASGQTTSTDKESATTPSSGNSPATPAATSNTPSISRGSPTGTRPSPLVSEVPIEDPRPPANTPPSFYGASEASATSSLGLPGFAAVAPEVQAPAEPGYPLQWGPFSFHPHIGYSFTYA